MAENDFLKVQFTVSDEFGRIYDTTDAEEAKKAGIFIEGAKYGEALVMLNDEHMVKGFRQALQQAKDGEESTARIAKEDAFGDRKEEMVVLVPLKKFEDAELQPQPGMRVDLDGSRGKVLSVSGGRVKVDLNPELAGKNIMYKFKILRRISAVEGKMDALLEEQMGVKGAVQIKGDSAAISVGTEIMRQDEYLQKKYYAIQAALQFIPELERLEWTEEFKRG